MKIRKEARTILASLTEAQRKAIEREILHIKKNAYDDGYDEGYAEALGHEEEVDRIILNLDDPDYDEQQDDFYW